MQLDRIEYRDVQTFVHQPVAGANAPEWRRTQHVGCSLTGILDNAVAGADVVQSKIAERVNDLVAKSCRYCESSTID